MTVFRDGGSGRRRRSPLKAAGGQVRQRHATSADHGLSRRPGAGGRSSRLADAARLPRARRAPRTGRVAGVASFKVARTTIDELLNAARRHLHRLDPLATLDAIRAGATLIDIRADSQIAKDGVVPNALMIPRNVLEWRVDPACEHRHPRAPQLEDLVILMCNEGYQSSLAAATLQQLGFARATDLGGGFQASRAAGLPIQPAAQAE
jgi:rhodanese-related sulfurtransferase